MYKNWVLNRFLATSVSAVVLVTIIGARLVMADDNTIEEIIVTAQKREQNIQDVSIAITALSGDELSKRQISSVEDLASVVPSMNFGAWGGFARISIRGIGYDSLFAGEARVAYHVNGAYISSPSAQLSSFYDVERIEVLRGPQGTLYGRNATGGSVNVVTKAPTDEFSGYARMTLGNYERVEFEGALNGSIMDGVTGRLAIKTSDQLNGYGEVEFNGDDIDNESKRGVRTTVSIQTLDDVSIILTGDYQRQDDNSFNPHYLGQYNPSIPFPSVTFGGTTASDLRDTNSEYTPSYYQENYGFSANVVFDLNWAMLKSITSYRYSEYRFQDNIDLTELILTTPEYMRESDQISEELQLSGEFGESNWLVGAYYFKEDSSAQFAIPISQSYIFVPNPILAEGFLIQADLATSAFAFFGQLDLAVTDSVRLIFGGRYNNEKLEIRDVFQLDFFTPFESDNPIIPIAPVYPREDSERDSAFMPKFGIEYSPNTNVLLYSTVSKGFKSGGFNIAIIRPAFEPESIWDYELGLKVDAFGGKLRSNLAAFYYDYKNLQVTKIINQTAVTENAADSELYGLEAEMIFTPTTALLFDGYLSYLHAEYKNYSSVDPGRAELGEQDLDGNRLYQSPEITAKGGVEYSWIMLGGQLTSRSELNYVSKVYFTPFNQKATSQDGNVKLNTYLTYESGNGHWSATAYGRNLTDKTTVAFAIVADPFFGAPVQGHLAEPRTFGIQIEVNF